MGGSSPARKTALNALLRMETRGAYSTLALDAALEKAALTPGDRALCAALFYGVLERRVTLDAMLAKHSRLPLSKLAPRVRVAVELGLYQLFFMDKIPPCAAVNESVELVKASKERSAAGFVNAVLRSAGRAGLPALPDGQSAEALSLRYSCPAELVESFMQDYGRDAAQTIMARSLGARDVTLRVNTRKTSPEALLELFARAGVRARRDERLPAALHADASGGVARLPGYEDGLFHAQDVSAMLVCELLAPHPGDKLLDVCASPGGKSFTCAQMMEDRGEIHAFDLHESRVNLIRSGARRLGLTCVRADVRDARGSWPADTPLFDCVLCDAPCSGYGVMRNKPEVKYKPLGAQRELPGIQSAILRSAAGRVAPGGRLVYATCTLCRAENDEVAAAFAAEHSDFEPLSARALLIARGIDVRMVPILDEDKPWITLLPGERCGDGFFMAAFRRKG